MRSSDPFRQNYISYYNTYKIILQYVYPYSENDNHYHREISFLNPVKPIELCFGM